MTTALILSNGMIFRVGDLTEHLGIVDSITVDSVTVGENATADEIDHWRVVIHEPVGDHRFLIIIKDYHVSAHMVEY